MERAVARLLTNRLQRKLSCSEEEEAVPDVEEIAEDVEDLDNEEEEKEAVAEG